MWRSKNAFADLSLLQTFSVNNDLVGCDWIVLGKNNLPFLFTQLPTLFVPAKVAEPATAVAESS
jgi:hypothetical protein